MPESTTYYVRSTDYSTPIYVHSEYAVVKRYLCTCISLNLYLNTVQRTESSEL